MKRLYKIEKGRKICGVCGGVAEYFAVDPVLVRVLFVLLAFSGAGLIAYIVAAAIMPNKSEVERDNGQPTQ